MRPAESEQGEGLRAVQEVFSESESPMAVWSQSTGSSSCLMAWVGLALGDKGNY